jgi:ribosomal protein L7Ae-like RNA K-turn-binding protein
LSQTAEGFNPPGLERPSPQNVPKTRFTAKQQARQKTAAAASEVQGVNSFDPEWAQYLQKKAVQKYGTPLAPLVEQKVNPRGPAPKAGGTAAPTAGNFTLQTSEYLKLLKDGDGHKGGEKKSWNQTGDKLFSKDVSMTGLKTDLAAALDSIIRTQQSNNPGGRKKADPFKLKDSAEARGSDGLMRLVRMMDNKDGGEEGKEQEDVLCTQDDVFAEAQNKDEDLAVPCYWSDDDQAPKAVKRASAHHAYGKVPGVRPRKYVTQNLDDDLDHQIAILLLHLRRLSSRQRVIEPEVSSAKRRLVVGLKEVARSVRQGKVKCVVVAPDIEEMAQSGAGVDERIREIVCSCYDQDTPVVFGLSRTRIGRALGKSLRMSALAIMDVTGVKDLYDDVLEKSYTQRVEWLAKQPKPEAPWKAKAAAKKSGAKA